MTTDGHVLFSGETIHDGQNAWQSIGGQEVGTILGHGAYVAPDWTADWLHRESVCILDRWAAEAGARILRCLSSGSEGRAAGSAAADDAALTPTTRRAITSWFDPMQSSGVRRNFASTMPTFFEGRNVRDPKRRAERSRETARHEHIFLVDVLGSVDQPPRAKCHLHAELAA